MLTPGSRSDRFFANRIHSFDSIDSTNRWLIQQQPDQPTICTANQQTDGRGRRNKNWQAPHGNLALSCSFSADTFGRVEDGMSLVIALAVCKALQHFGVHAQAKWPNDVLVSGKKIVGILLQLEHWKHSPYLIIGIGVNNQHAPQEQSCCIATITGSPVHNAELAGSIMEQVIDFLDRYKNFGLDAFRSQWLQQDPWYGKQVQLMIGNSTRTGLHAGINNHGFLLLRNGNQNIAYSSGDVSLRPI